MINFSLLIVIKHNQFVRLNWRYINIYTCKQDIGNQSIQHRHYETIVNNFHQTIILLSYLLYQYVHLQQNQFVRFNWPYINICKQDIGNQSIHHRNYETIINNFHQNIIILSNLLYQYVHLRGFIHFIFSFKYSSAHCEYDLIVYHQSESVTSCINDFMYCFMGTQKKCRLYSKYVRT